MFLAVGHPKAPPATTHGGPVRNIHHHHGASERPHKRARKVQSCARCRRRKIKCDLDGSGGPCSKCRGARVDCTMFDDDYQDPRLTGGVFEAPAPRRLNPSKPRNSFHGRSSAASTPTQCLSLPLPTPMVYRNDSRASSYFSYDGPASTSSLGNMARCEGLDLLSQASLTATALEREVLRCRREKAGTPETPMFSDPTDDTQPKAGTQLLQKDFGFKARPPASFLASGASPVLLLPRCGPISQLIPSDAQASILSRAFPGCHLAVRPKHSRPSRPTREHPAQPLSTLDWFGAFAASGHDLNLLRHLDKAGCFELPPDDVVEHLMVCYFERVHPAYPLLDAGFEASLWGVASGEDENVAEVPSLLVIWSALLAGARYSSHHFIVGSQKPYGSMAPMGTRLWCDAVYQKARALLVAELEVDPVAKVQAGLLLGLFGEGDRTLEHLSSAIRSAQRQGLHKAATESEADSLARRIWTSAVAADRFVAVAEGVSPMISEADAQGSDLLAPVDFASEADNPLVPAVAEATYSLSLLLGRILAYRPSASNGCEALEDLERDLLAFPTSLPPLLRDQPPLVISSTTGKSALDGAQGWAASLRLQYFGLTMLLHSCTAGSASVALEAAHETADFVRILEIRQCGGASGGFLTSIMERSLVGMAKELTPDADEVDPGEARETGKRFDTVVETLKELGSVWWCAASRARLATVVKAGLERSSPDGSPFNSSASGSDDEDAQTTDGFEYGYGSKTPSEASEMDDAWWEAVGVDPNALVDRISA